MTVTLRGANSADAYATTVSLPYPSSPLAGDFDAVLVVSSATTPTFSSEWTVTTVGANAWVAYRWRPADDSATNLTFANAGEMIAVLASYRGVTSAAIGASASLVAPSVTGSSGSVPLRLFGAVMSASGSIAASVANFLASDYTIAHAYLAVSAGADGALSGTSSGTSTATASHVTSSAAVTILMAADSPPNTASWVSPSGGTALDRSVDQVLTYTATDPDSGDSQSKRQWRYSSDGGTTWTTTTETTVSQSITIAGGTLAAGSYQFQVMIADQSGTWATAWSPSLHLTFADAPSAPTITEPTSGGTVAATNTLAWSFPDQQQYEARKVADDAGTADPTTIYYDTGVVPDSVTRDLTMVNDTNGRWEHQQVRGMDSTGLWSTWADSRADVTFDPPPAPTVTLTPNGATITVTLAVAAPGTGEVAATSGKIEARPVGATVTEWSRSGTDVDLAGDTVFQTPASSVEYELRATTIGDNGATTATDWLTTSS